MANLKDQPVGSLKITSPEVTATHFMPEFLHGFTAKYSRITVELIATNQHLDIIRERVDFAFRVGDVTGQDLIVRRISSIHRSLVASPAYLTISAPLRDPSDLSGHRCLLHDAQCDWSFTSRDQCISLRPPAAATSDSMGFLLHTSIAGGGIVLLPAYVCQPAIASGRLVALLPGWEIPSYDMVLISPRLKNQSKAQTAFRSYADAFDF